MFISGSYCLTACGTGCSVGLLHQQCYMFISGSYCLTACGTGCLTCTADDKNKVTCTACDVTKGYYLKDGACSSKSTHDHSIFYYILRQD